MGLEGFDKWLETNPFETSSEHIEEISENTSDDFFKNHEDFLYTEVFYTLCDKIVDKNYFVDFKKSATIIERLFHLYKLN